MMTMESSGRVKSINTSKSSITELKSSTTLIPRVPRPDNSPASLPIERLLGLEIAAANVVSLACSAALQSTVPMRPDTPTIAIRIMI